MDISIYPIEDMMRAISIVFMVVKDYMLVSGKVESWFVIVEAKNTTAYKIPFNVNIYLYINSIWIRFLKY